MSTDSPRRRKRHGPRPLSEQDVRTVQVRACCDLEITLRRNRVASLGHDFWCPALTNAASPEGQQATLVASFAVQNVLDELGISGDGDSPS